jgi:hypothetical protein
MFEPEYRVGFLVLKKEIGLFPTLKVVIPAAFKSLVIKYKADRDLDDAEEKKTGIKNHFRLLAFTYKEVQRRFGTQKTNEIMHEVLMKGGQVFFRGFEPLGSEDNLLDFSTVYRDFESHNVVFDVVEESRQKFEIVIRRCLIYEAFKELGMGDLTQWMCDIAFAYFRGYHPKITYVKDGMIARGDETCHEIFMWQG